MKMQGRKSALRGFLILDLFELAKTVAQSKVQNQAQLPT
jgi:hypothetical protein